MKKKLHILFISSWYPSRVILNNGDFIQRHAEAVSLKHEVTVIHVITDKNIYKKFEIVDEKINGVRTVIAYIKPNVHLVLKAINYFSAYIKIIKKVGAFDLVHLNVIYPAGLISLYLKYFRQKPYLISEHWANYYKPYCEQISFFNKMLMLLIAKNSEVICPVTNNLGYAMQQFGLKNNYVKVPNVVNTDLFIPARKEVKTFNIIHVSNMCIEKNIPKILKVISKLQECKIDYKFYLIGENATKFKKLSSQLKIDPSRIVFKNQIPQTELAIYMQQSDVLVLFSEIESSSCVLLEAMSSGINVISTNVGGTSENIPKKYGCLIDKDDKKAFLNALIASKDKRNTISKKEMHSYVVKNFSKEVISQKFTDLYYSILDKK